MKLAVLTLGFCFSPSLFAVSYTWDFTGSGGSNCQFSTGNCGAGNAGNSLVFSAAPSGGPTVTATAWYIDSSGLFQKATLGQYSAGLGVCYSTENCQQPEHQVDNNGFREYVLFTFSSPVDPSSMGITTTSSSDMDASYWMGGNSGVLNLAGVSVANLSTLGFTGTRNDSNSSSGTSRTIDLTVGNPPGTVNAILFGASYLNSDGILDYFKIGNMGGTASVPEPSSVLLLATVGLAALHLARRSKRTNSAA
jgi:hypothetical protein